MSKASSHSMIEIMGLKKSYGDFVALRGLSFSVPMGQVVGFLGPNGAGKSTTMKILTGYLPYSDGSVKIGGLEVRDHLDSIRDMIGYLPENNPQYEEMMVIEYLEFIAEIRKIAKSHVREKILRSVERCGLKQMLGKDIGQLSKGYRQRVGLAQAILHSPRLLILDEPTSGLDPNQIIEIRNLIKELGKETTVLMSTHILQEAQSTCDRILIINNGLLVADDTPEQLTESDQGSIYLEIVSRDGHIIKEGDLFLSLRKAPGVMDIERQSPEGLASMSLKISYEKADPRRGLFEEVLKANLILLEMKKQKASLEETFRKLTSNV